MESIFINGIEIRAELEEKYLQINRLPFDRIEEIWNAVKVQYPHHEVVFTFHNVAVDEKPLDAIGARLLEDCFMTEVTKDTLHHITQDDITLLTRDEFINIADHHDALHANDDFYWMSTRILEHWETFNIFAHHANGTIDAYCLLMTRMRDPNIGEFFTVTSQNAPIRAALLSQASAHAFTAHGKQRILLTVETHDAELLSIAESIGFYKTGIYTGYTAQT